MLQITVNVIGPGKTFADIFYHIEYALTEKGYNVEVHDEHPPKKPYDPDEDIEDDETRNIVLKAVHEPWGG